MEKYVVVLPDQVSLEELEPYHAVPKYDAETSSWYFSDADKVELFDEACENILFKKNIMAYQVKNDINKNQTSIIMNMNINMNFVKFIIGAINVVEIIIGIVVPFGVFLTWLYYAFNNMPNPLNFPEVLGCFMGIIVFLFCTTIGKVYLKNQYNKNINK